MGEKKKKEAEVASWKKVVVVGACVLFVVLMVVSGMGSGWLTMFSSVKPGQGVVIDYTIYDGAGKPVITSNDEVYSKAVKEGSSILAAKQMTVVANQSMSTPIYPVQVYVPSSGTLTEFAIFASEYDTISSGVVGMKTNEKKTLTLPYSSSMSQLWEKEILEKRGISMDDVSIGTMFAMGVSDTTAAEMDANTTADTYMRMGEVTRKTDSGVVVDFGYPRMDIKVVQFGTTSSQ